MFGSIFNHFRVETEHDYVNLGRGYILLTELKLTITNMTNPGHGKEKPREKSKSHGGTITFSRIP